MDVGLTSEQLSLRDTVRDILRTECPPDAARQAMTDPERWRTLWKTVVDLGWTELAAPDATATSDPSSWPWFSRNAARPSRRSRCSAASVWPRACCARGRRSTRCSPTSPAASSPPWRCTPPGSRLPGATDDAAHGRLRGRAVAVPNLSRAELIVTLATIRRRAGGRGRALRRRRDASGGRVHRPRATGGRRRDRHRASGRRAPVDIESALAAPLVAAAADLVGVASAALHRSVEHAKSRRQFGTPIGAFQGIKHALADNYVSLERARSLTYAAAARLGDPSTRDPRLPGPPRRWPRRRPATRRPTVRAPRSRCTAPSRRPGSTTSTSTSGTPGRARRCWATAARSTTKWAARFAGGAA